MYMRKSASSTRRVNIGSMVSRAAECEEWHIVTAPERRVFSFWMVTFWTESKSLPTVHHGIMNCRYKYLRGYFW